jgi:SH3-like domain-containing protein
MGKKIILFFIAFVLLVPPVIAQEDQPPEKSTSSGLPIPRFVSLASEKVFVRTGPALRYPIKWVYGREHMPVEIVQEFDTWRKIRDVDGDDGWVHQSLLSGDRHVIIKGEGEQPLLRAPSEDAPAIAALEAGVIAAANACEGAWCQVMAGGYTGWMMRKFLWGVYDSEDFD